MKTYTKVACFLLAVSTFGGCAAYSVHMNTSGQGPDYIILWTRGDRQKIFDCYSMPYGEDWQPICVQTHLKKQAPEPPRWWLDQRYSSTERSDSRDERGRRDDRDDRDDRD